MGVRALVVLVSLALAPAARAGTNTWTNSDLGVLAPWGLQPYVMSIAIDPTNNSTVYVGTSTELRILKSTDGGITWSPSWTCVGPQCLFVDFINDIAVHPEDSSRLFAASGGGLFESTDGGASWANINPVFQANSIAFDPNNPSTMYCGTTDELFESTDGGSTWNWLAALNNSSPGSGYSVAVRDILIDPNDPSRIYVATGDGGFPNSAKRGVWKSTDGGASWTHSNIGILSDADREVRALAIDPNNSNVLYAGVSDFIGRWDGGVFKSTNGGLTWTPVNTGLTGLNNPDRGGTCAPNACDARTAGALLFDEVTNTLYAGTSGSGVFRTTNGGTSWTAFNTGFMYSNVPPQIADSFHLQFRALAVDPVTPSRLYAGTYRGLFVRDACGDGTLNTGESCDDGDASGGDGCSALCQVEECHVCSSGPPSVCSPVPSGTTCNADDNPCTVDKCNSGSSLCEVTAPPPGWSCNGAVEGMVGGPQRLCENGVRDEGNDTCTLTSPSGHSLVIPDDAVSGSATNISIIEKGSCSFSLIDSNQKIVACVEFEPSGQGYLDGQVTAILRWDNVAEGTGCADRPATCPVMATDNTRTCEGRLHVYGPGGVELTDQCGKASAGGVVCPGSTTLSTKCVSPCTGSPTCDPVANTWTIDLQHFSEYALVADPCNTDVLPTCRTAEKSLFLIKEGRDVSKDKLTWKWLKGDDTTLEELGEPASNPNYSLCMYAGAEEELVGTSTFSPSFSYWNNKGFIFKDGRPIPTTGIKKAIVRSGSSGRAQVVVKGKGQILPDPLYDGPLPLPVRVQLLNSSTDACFEQVYESGDVIKNDGAQFKAKTKTP